jgi:hydrogenase maturation factor
MNTKLLIAVLCAAPVWAQVNLPPISVVPPTASGPGELRVKSGAYYVGITAPTLTESGSWKLPAGPGDAGQCVTTDGAWSLVLSSVCVNLTGTAPFLTWTVSDQATDGKKWDIEAFENTFNFRIAKDDYSAKTKWLEVSRSAYAITQVYFPTAITVGGVISSGNLEGSSVSISGTGVIDNSRNGAFADLDFTGGMTQGGVPRIDASGNFTGVLFTGSGFYSAGTADDTVNIPSGGVTAATGTFPSLLGAVGFPDGPVTVGTDAVPTKLTSDDVFTRILRLTDNGSPHGTGAWILKGYTNATTNYLDLYDGSGNIAVTFSRVLFSSPTDYASFDMDILPKTDEGWSLGSGSYRWNSLTVKDVDVSGTCVGCFDGSTGKSIIVSSGTALSIIDTSASASALGIAGSSSGTNPTVLVSNIGGYIAGKFSNSSAGNPAMQVANLGGGAAILASDGHVEVGTDIVPVKLTSDDVFVRNVRMLDNGSPHGTGAWIWKGYANAVSNYLNLYDSSGNVAVAFSRVAFSSATNLAAFDMDLVPNTNEGWSLGSGSLRWKKLTVKDLDVSGTCVGCFDGSTGKSIIVSSGTALSIIDTSASASALGIAGSSSGTNPTLLASNIGGYIAGKFANSSGSNASLHAVNAGGGPSLYLDGSVVVSGTGVDIASSGTRAGTAYLTAVNTSGAGTFGSSVGARSLNLVDSGGTTKATVEWDTTNGFQLHGATALSRDLTLLNHATVLSAYVASDAKFHTDQLVVDTSLVIGSGVNFVIGTGASVGIFATAAFTLVNDTAIQAVNLSSSFSTIDVSNLGTGPSVSVGQGRIAMCGSCDIGASGAHAGTAYVTTVNASSTGIFGGTVTVNGGGNTVYRCATAGATLPVGSLTINSSACGSVVSTGLLVN